MLYIYKLQRNPKGNQIQTIKRPKQHWVQDPKRRPTEQVIQHRKQKKDQQHGPHKKKQGMNPGAREGVEDPVY